MEQSANAPQQPSWKIKDLTKSSFARMKLHYKEYVKISLLIIFIMIFTNIWEYIFKTFLSKFFLIHTVLNIVLYTLQYLLILWLGLASMITIMKNENIKISDALKSAREIFKSYLWFSFTLIFFYFGIIMLCYFVFAVIGLAGALLFPKSAVPILVASSVVSFSMLILWIIWGGFALYVFVEKRYRGLKNLWVSAALINQKFWSYILIALLLSLISLIIYIPYLYIIFKFALSHSFLITIAGYLVTLLSYLTITPFTTAFFYEMYKTLTHPVEVKTPKKWLWAVIISAILSLIIGILSIGLLIGGYGKDLPALLKNSGNLKLKQELMQKENLFQEELGKLDINPVMTINYKDEEKSICGPGYCRRSLEVIYGGDKPFREKVTEISEEFAAKGWKFRKITDAKDVIELEQQFDEKESILIYADFTKDILHARIIFAKPNANGCSVVPKLCEYANKQLHPYVISISYYATVQDKKSMPGNNRLSQQNSFSQPPQAQISPRIVTPKPTLTSIPKSLKALVDKNRSKVEAVDLFRDSNNKPRKLVLVRSADSAYKPEIYIADDASDTFIEVEKIEEIANYFPYFSEIPGTRYIIIKSIAGENYKFYLIDEDGKIINANLINELGKISSQLTADYYSRAGRGGYTDYGVKSLDNERLIFTISISSGSETYSVEFDTKTGQYIKGSEKRI
jgi:hypothetical protein